MGAVGYKLFYTLSAIKINSTDLTGDIENR